MLIGALLCPIDSAELARGVLAEIPLFFYAAEIAAAKMLFFFRKSAAMDILTKRDSNRCRNRCTSFPFADEFI